MSKSSSSDVLCEVVKTGREVDTVVFQLLTHSNDKEDAVKSQIQFALHDLGLAQPLLVLSSMCTFLQKNGKLDQAHRIIILKQLHSLLETQNARDALEASKSSEKHSESQLVTSLIKFCAKEMTQSADAVTEISSPCSSCLTLLAGVSCTVVVDECLLLFPAGSVPHYYIVKTLADIASNHPVEFVQKLKEVMGRMTPVIGNIKKSPMKWVFSTAYGRFSESMGHYQASQAEAGIEHPEISSASFEIHMASAFDCMWVWMNEEKEVKVRFACYESLGQMCLLLDKQALEVRLPKLIPTYLMRYKQEKPADHLPISHGLYSTLREGVKIPTAMAPLIQSVLMTLHPMIARPIDFTQPSTAKTHNELLRCFEILARYDLEAVLQFVIGRFQLKERESRMSSLIILRHFVNSLEDILEPEKKPSIMSAVLTLLQEQDLQLKKTILQLIVSMANQNYFNLEGGQQLVRFIMQQCSLLVEGEDRDGKITVPVGSPNSSSSSASSPAAASGATPLAIRNAGNHILGVMANKVKSTHCVLWPYLLEFIIEPEYNRSILQIIKALETIGQQKRVEESPDYIINFEAQVNMPSPQALLVRLMVLACEPFRAKGDQGVTMCRAMQSLGPIIHPAIGKYFDESAPSLLAYLEQHTSDSINTTKWQDTLLKMWKETISLIDNVKWLQDLATTLTDQYKLYKNDSSLIRCLHRYLGSVLSKVEARTILQTSIDLMLNNVNHASDLERQGVAQGLGLAAAVHLDIILPKLTERLAVKEAPKPTGFFSSFSSSDKPQGPDEKLASTITLCYGYVTAYANPELIISRLDVHILHNLLPLMQKARSPLLKTNLIKSIDLIGKAIHSSRLPEAKKTWKLAQRDELMKGLLLFLGAPKIVEPSADGKKKEAPKPTKEDENKPAAPKPSLELKLLGINACATLSNLEPPLPSDLRKRLCETVFPFYGLTNPADNIDAKKLTSPKSPNSEKDKQPQQEESITNADGENMLELIMTNMNTLLTSLIQMEPTVPSLLDLLRLLDTWCSSAKLVERERSSQSMLVLLKKFVSKCVHEKIPMSNTNIPELGNFLAAIMTRCNDSSITVRQIASENIQALLYISQILGNPENPKPQQEIKLITEIRNRLAEDVVNDERLGIIRDLCSLLTVIVSTQDLILVTSSLLQKGCLDQDLSSAQGAALFVKLIVYTKAADMQSGIKSVVLGLLNVLKILRQGEVSDIIHATFRILTRIHFQLVLDHLLESTTPLSRDITDAFTSLVESGPADSASSSPLVVPIGMEPEYDIVLAEKTLKYVLNIINDTPMVSDKPTPLVMTATSAISQMLHVEGMEKLINANYADILATLLMRIGTASGVDKDGASAIDACSAVRAFCEAMKEDVLLRKLNTEAIWPILESPSYDDGMTSFTRSFCEVHPDRKRSLLQFLSKFYSQQSYTGQRIVATSMLAEFVNHAAEDEVFLREVIKYLLPRVADKVEKVRKHALRGLGHLVTVWNAETSAMATSVLSSLTAAAEDADPDVAAEAVLSLTRIAGVVNESLIGPMLISICFRLRPAFDRKEELVRARAFTLFGCLHRYGIASDAMDEGVRGNFLDQVHSNLPIFIVHCNDAQMSVREAAVQGFRQIAPLLGEEFVPVLAEATGEQSNYDELVQRLVPLLNTHHADRLRGYLENTTQYFTSVSTSMRASSAYLAGILLATSAPEQRKTVSIPSLVSELIKLLDDGQATVRSRAAKSLSMCHHV